MKNPSPRCPNAEANSSLNAPWPKELGGETGGTTVPYVPKHLSNGWQKINLLGKGLYNKLSSSTGPYTGIRGYNDILEFPAVELNLPHTRLPPRHVRTPPGSPGLRGVLLLVQTSFSHHWRLRVIRSATMFCMETCDLGEGWRGITAITPRLSRCQSDADR